MSIEAPKFLAPMQGPLDNPEWTDEQNRAYDKGENFKTVGQAREDALTDGTELREIPAAAQRTIEATGTKSTRLLSNEEKIVRDAIADRDRVEDEKLKRRDEESMMRTAPDAAVLARLKQNTDRYGKLSAGQE